MKGAIAILCLALLAACAPKLREGEISDKGHKAAETILIMMPLTTCSGGKVTTCNTMLIPMFFFYPERWYVRIRKFDGQKWQSATWWVPSDTYQQVVVGGYFKIDKRCLSSEPRQRTEKNT